MSNSLVVGGDSRLGLCLIGLLRGDKENRVRWTSRREHTVRVNPPATFLDLLNPALLDDEFLINKGQGHVTYIVAAMTEFGACEGGGAATSWRVNADAPGAIARQASRLDSFPVFVSSDAVEFAPHTAYAMQKVHAELAVLAAGGGVVRPARIAEEGDYLQVAEFMTRMAECRYNAIVRWPG